MIVLAEDDKLLPRPLGQERGHRLERPGEDRREVDEEGLALELGVVFAEDLGDGRHAALHVRVEHASHHARVVVDLEQVLSGPLLEGQQIDRLLHDLGAVADKGLLVAEHLLDVHASEAADHDGPTLRVAARHEVVPIEVLRHLGILEVIDAAVRAEDQRRSYPLRGLAHVELLGAQVLQQHDVRGLVLDLQVRAPQRELALGPDVLRLLAGLGQSRGQGGSELGELGLLGGPEAMQVGPREVHRRGHRSGGPAGRAGPDLRASAS
mmetsp:Transcript_3130/g.9169  ORF Transcript_3130/g.9169 Transcript_3130/m.9169 type:complete len:266 (-) Transcript_3130:13-810(-)